MITRIHKKINSFDSPGRKACFAGLRKARLFPLASAIVCLVLIANCAQFDSQGSPLGYLLLPQGGISGGGAAAAGTDSGGGSTTTTPAVPWALGGWTKRREINFNNAAQTENLDDFPLLVKLDSTRVDYTAMQADGADLCFLDDDNATQLDHEIAVWDTAGTSTVWVRVPRIDAGSTTDTIYMYYGGAGTCAQNATGVWNAAYSGVWHMDELPFSKESFYSSAMNEPEIVTVSGSVRAVVFSDVDGDGRLYTLNVATDGSIGSFLDGLEFDTTQASDIEIIHISGDVYALVYQGVNQGIVKTVQIGTDGTIAGVLDTLVYDANNGGSPDVLHVSGNVYAVAHAGLNADGYLSTITIQTNGTITGVNNTFNFWGADTSFSELINISGNIFAVAFQDVSTLDGFLITTQINNDGSFGGTVIDTLEFDPVKALDIDMLAIGGTVYAMVHQGTGDDGFLRTFNIATDGTITGQIAQLEFEAGLGIDTKIAAHTGDIYLINYTSWGGDGWVQSVQITAAGALTAIEDYEWNASRGQHGDLLQLASGVFTVAARSNNSWLWLQTLWVDDNGYFFEAGDSTSNKRYAKAVGNMSPTDQVSGVAGTAIDFDGVDDGIYIGNPPSLAATNFTISLWAQPTAGLGAGDGLIGPYDGTGWGLRNDDAGSGPLEFLDENGGTNRYYTTASLLTTSVWQHLVLTYDGSQYRIYKDGVEQYASAASQAAPTDGTFMYIGRLRSAGFEFPGQIDEVRMSSTNRSADWIAAVYLSESDSFMNIQGEETP